MGLDGVMIVMSVEDTFGIKISDAEAADLRTPDQLAAIVADRVQALPNEQCLTQQTYYRLRRGFHIAIPALASDLRLETPLKDLVHRDQWSRVWRAVREAAEAPEWPAHVPWPELLNAAPRTVRELVWHLAIALTPVKGQGPERWTKQQVAHTVRRIIIEESGIPIAFDSKRTFSQLGIL